MEDGGEDKMEADLRDREGDDDSSSSESESELQQQVEQLQESVCHESIGWSYPWFTMYEQSVLAYTPTLAIKTSVACILYNYSGHWYYTCILS